MKLRSSRSHPAVPWAGIPILDLNPVRMRSRTTGGFLGYAGPNHGATEIRLVARAEEADARRRCEQERSSLWTLT